jgi:Ca-activated chloride channel family protein
MRTRLAAALLAVATSFSCSSPDRAAAPALVGSGTSASGQGSPAAGGEGKLVARAERAADASAVTGTPSTVAPPRSPLPAPRLAAGRARLAGPHSGMTSPAKDIDGGPRGDTFTDYGVNAWIKAADDKLSTFAADVDTASFTIARRMLREGTLPPAAAVRVEEFVNYFKYGYPTDAVTADRPFQVSVDGAASPLHAGRHLLRVGVASRAKPASERPPANLVFLVDVSGSMKSPDKLELAKRSLRLLVDSLKDGDTVALVTYAGSTGVVLPATGLEHKAEILAALENLTAGGGTAMQSGLQLAYAEAAKGLRPGAISRVIVLSDGDANIGATTHEQLLTTIATQVQAGVTLSTVGFGQGNYQDTTMEQLANKGNGNASYIDSLSTARRVFTTFLGSTLEVVAKDVKLQVEFDPSAVASYRLIGYENRDIADDDFRDDKVDAGEIGAGHQVTALYELELAAGASATSGDLATVRVRHKDPTGDVAREAAFPIPSASVRGALATGSSDLRLAVAAALFADVLRGAAAVRDVSLATLRDLAAGVDSSPDRVALLDMIDQAIALRGGNPATTGIAAP